MPRSRSQSSYVGSPETVPGRERQGLTCSRLSLFQLETLPPLLSYTPVTVPLSGEPGRTATLLRRDLFDARFQVLNQDEVDADETTKPAMQQKGKAKEVFIDEQSDLVKGVYEGGLKTWECSLDLVDCLDQQGFALDRELETARVRDSAVLEVKRLLMTSAGPN